MNKTTRFLLSFLFVTAFAVFLAQVTAHTAFAAGNSLPGITNPVLPALASDPEAAQNGTTFSSYFITVWRALIVVGGLAVLFNLVNGAIEWITAGGEKGKVEHARQKMTQGIMGMVLLVGSFAIVSFVSSVFGFNLLKATLPTPTGAQGTSTDGQSKFVKPLTPEE